MFIFGLHLKIWSETFLRDSIMKGPFFSSSKGNKHGRWEVGKLTFTTILTFFHQFYCTGTFKNICLSRRANKNAGGSRANLSLSKDGNILKKQQRQRWEPVAARRDLLAECNGEAAQFVRGGRLPSHFHPPAIFGGGLFFYLADVQHLPPCPRFMFFFLYLSQSGLHIVSKRLFGKRQNSYSSIPLSPQPESEEVGGRVNYDKGSEQEETSTTCPLMARARTIIPARTITGKEVPELR